MNLNFKTICSVAVLMCSVPAVFGMQDGKRSYPDESAEPHSKVSMITVSESEDFLKSLSKPQLEEKLKSARQELKSARQNVENFQWLYNDALDRAQSADKRAKIITEQFGEAACLKQGISQDKAKAEQDAESYLELLRDAEIREKNADTRIDTLTRIFEALGISSQATDDKVIPGSHTPEPSVNFSISTDQEVRDVRMAEHNDRQSLTNNGKSSVAALNEFCQREDNPYNLHDVKFKYTVDSNGNFNCIVEMNGEIFSQDALYRSKRDAKNSIAKYVLGKLMQREDPVLKREDPVLKLKEYLDKSTKYKAEYIYDVDSNGYLICKIKIGDEEYNLNKWFKHQIDAKNETAKYAYNLLISKEANTENSPQASSSGTNQQQITEEPHSSSFEKLEDLVKSKPNLSVDYNYIYDRNKGSKFIITVKKNGEKDRKFDQDRFYKHYKDARNAIAEYVYNVLKKEEANAENGGSNSSD